MHIQANHSALSIWSNCLPQSGTVTNRFPNNSSQSRTSPSTSLQIPVALMRMLQQLVAALLAQSQAQTTNQMPANQKPVVAAPTMGAPSTTGVAVAAPQLGTASTAGISTAPLLGTAPSTGTTGTTGVGPLPPRGPAAYPDTLKPSYSNVPYANVSPTQKLDIFVPQGPGPFPVVLNIHGGGFRMGSKEMLDESIAQALLKKGIAVVSVDYRLSPEAKFPAALEDVKAATRYLRANAAQYNLDPNRFLAFGQSAGGNLASMLGTSGGVPEFDNPALGNPKVSSRVQGVVDWFGPTDFSLMDAQAKAQSAPASNQTHGAANSPESEYLGRPLAEVPGLVQKTNPLNYISKDDPPFLIQKGDQDVLVPVAQSKILADALKAAGVPVELDILAGAGHGDSGPDDLKFLSERNVARVVEFMVDTLT